MPYPGLDKQLRQQTAEANAHRVRTDQARHHHPSGAPVPAEVAASVSAEATYVSCSVHLAGTEVFFTEAGPVCGACFQG